MFYTTPTAEPRKTWLADLLESFHVNQNQPMLDWLVETIKEAHSQGVYDGYDGAINRTNLTLSHLGMYLLSDKRLEEEPTLQNSYVRFIDTVVTQINNYNGVVTQTKGCPIGIRITDAATYSTPTYPEGLKLKPISGHVILAYDLVLSDGTCILMNLVTRPLQPNTRCSVKDLIKHVDYCTTPMSSFELDLMAMRNYCIPVNQELVLKLYSDTNARIKTIEGVGYYNMFPVLISSKEEFSDLSKKAIYLQKDWGIVKHENRLTVMVTSELAISELVVDA